MTADRDHFMPVDPLHHIEGLASVTDRVVRKKEQQQQRQKRKSKQQIEEQLEDDPNSEIDDGHVDFCA